MTVAIDKKPLGGKLKQAAAQGQAGSHKDCANCTKVGLAIMPVVSTPALRMLLEKFKDTESDVAWLKALESGLETDDRTKSWDFMRALPPGYLYVLKSNKSWDAYVVGGDGLLKKTPVGQLDEDPNTVKLSQNCARDGHSNTKPQFICIDPELYTGAWFAYSPHRWTEAVRKRYEDDVDGCRLRMSYVDLAAAAQGAVGKGKAVPNATLATANALRRVADFTPKRFRLRLQGELLYPLYNRDGQAESVAQAMAVASAKVPSKQGIVLVIRDPVGKAEELNHLRLKAVQDHHAWESGGVDASGSNPDLERAWKRQSATHVAYLEAWAASLELASQQRGVGAHVEMIQQIRRNRGALGAMTQQSFNERLLPMTTQPLRPARGGLNPYHKAKWVPMLGDNGKPVASGMGYVEYHQDYWDALARHHAGIRTEKRVGRMHERLRIDELKAFNQQYETQAQGWYQHILALDQDYVKYLEKPEFEQVMLNDFEDKKNWVAAQGRPNKVRELMADLAARLKATERALGGAAVSEHSVAYFKKQIDKKIDERDNWIAKALGQDYGFFAVMKSEWKAPSTAPDLYEIAAGGLGNLSREGRREWSETYAAYREAAQASAQSLLLPVTQTINHLRMKALADAGADLSKAQAVLDQLAGKEVVWVRVSALQEYMGSIKSHYSIQVKWNLGEYLDARVGAFALPAFELQARSTGDRGAVRSEMRQGNKQLKKLAKDPRFANQTVTVPLIVQAGVLERAAGKAGEQMLQVYSDDLLGVKQAPSSLPKSVVEQLVGRPPGAEQGWVKKLVNREGFISGLALILSFRETWEAIGDLSTSSGFEQADVVTSLMSGITGLGSAGAELAAIHAQAALKAGTQATGAVTAGAYTKALGLRLAAGVLGAAGAFADAASAFVKAQRARATGNRDAFVHYGTAAGVLFVSGASSLGGAFVTWRSALAARAGAQTVQLVGRQAAVGVARGVALRTAAGAMLGASLTGVGLVLFAVGIIWALYAQSLEDDDNEAFLRRCFWGKREADTKAIGGPRPAEAASLERWVVDGLEAEMLALGNLALGLKGEITDWNGNWFANDVVEFKFTFAGWEPKGRRLEYTLTAFKDQHRSTGATVLRRGSTDVELPQPDDEVHVLQIEHPIDDDSYKSVELQFSYYKDNELIGQDKLWASEDKD